MLKEGTNNSNYYFAYGSNLNFKDSSDWCRRNGFPFPQEWLRPVWPAYLPDHALAFSRYSDEWKEGVLNIIPAVGCRVPGMIFDVTGNGWEILDKKEGAPSFYCRKEVDVIGENSETHGVTAYKAVDNEPGHIEPSEEYRSVVRQGLNDFDVERSPLEEAIKNMKRPGEIDSLFAYGTLMRGEKRHSYLSDHHPECILLAETWGRLFDFGSYPGMILDLKTIPMAQGEFYTFPSIEDVLPKLDEIEGFDPNRREQSLFQRILISVGLGDGHVRPAWTYTTSNKYPEKAAINSGDWREHRGNKNSIIKEIVQRHCENISDLDSVINQFGRIKATKKELKEENVETKQELVFKAILEHRLSERKLAQCSDQWAVEYPPKNKVTTALLKLL